MELLPLFLLLTAVAQAVTSIIFLVGTRNISKKLYFYTGIASALVAAIAGFFVAQGWVDIVGGLVIAIISLLLITIFIDRKKLLLVLQIAQIVALVALLFR